MKKKISAEIIADSKNEAGDRITTFVLTFPRIILAELNTHRVFSRNSASSRAIPFKRMLEMVTEDPFIPMAWQKDHSGMQGTEYFTDENMMSGLCEKNWIRARDNAISTATALNNSGLTKQLCNRLLEPFMWHTAIVTATEFENFFKQRCPQYKSESGMIHRSKKDYIFQGDFPKEDGDLSQLSTIDWLYMNEGQGEIHIMELAEQMWDALNESTPNELKAGEWHIPFGDKMDIEEIDILRRNLLKSNKETDPEDLFSKLKIKIATARCARISYLNFDGTDDYEKDIKLHDRLASMFHWSPFEHCAKAMIETEYVHGFGRILEKTENVDGYEKKTFSTGYSRNFKGFIQYRSIVEKQ